MTQSAPFDGLEMAEFKPCVIELEGLTMILLEDCAAVSEPVVPHVYHTVDWLKSFDGRIIGVQVWH